MKQSIPLKSIKNARELGGYTTTDGRKIKTGLLLRTAALGGISEQDVKILTDTYNLQHIVDFRMDMEIEKGADPEIDGAMYHHFDVIDLSLLSNDDAADFEVDTSDIIKTVEITIKSGFLNDNMYIGFLAADKGKNAYSEFFRILINSAPDRAVLWHCTNGKDRTGLGAMLILSALGADEDLIIEDYLLTNEYFADRIESTKQLLKSKGLDDDYITQALLVFDCVDKQYMINAMAYLKKTYGSVMGYIRGGLNITEDEINSLKEKYLI